MFFSRVGNLFVMSEDSLTIEYNERTLRSKINCLRHHNMGLGLEL